LWDLRLTSATAPLSDCDSHCLKKRCGCKIASAFRMSSAALSSAYTVNAIAPLVTERRQRSERCFAAPRSPHAKESNRSNLQVVLQCASPGM
jgi:hypothetical protein